MNIGSGLSEGILSKSFDTSSPRRLYSLTWTEGTEPVVVIRRGFTPVFCHSRQRQNRAARGCLWSRNRT